MRKTRTRSARVCSSVFSFLASPWKQDKCSVSFLGREPDERPLLSLVLLSLLATRLEVCTTGTRYEGSATETDPRRSTFFPWKPCIVAQTDGCFSSVVHQKSHAPFQSEALQLIFKGSLLFKTTIFGCFTVALLKTSNFD